MNGLKAGWLVLLLSGLPLCGAQAKAGPDVLVVSDVFSNTPDSLRPKPGKPIYYYLLGKVQRALGAALAGEPLPDPATLEKEVIRVLAQRGFVRTQVGGPIPSLAIIITWGTANLAGDQLASSDPTTGAGSSSEVFYDADEIAQLVGADKASRHFMMNNEADRINHAAEEGRGYVFIGAFDAQALAKKKKTLLWRTRISISTRHYSLPDSLAVMLASAAPFFAADTQLPVFVDDADRRKASVDIGKLTVVPDGGNKAPAAAGANPPAK